MGTKGAAILTGALEAALAFFFLIGRLNAQQVVENSDKPVSKNAGRVLPLQPVFRIADQEPQWKGKIETENGIKVVKNPKDPLYGEIKFDLQEDLSIGGNENDNNYYFPKGAWSNVDGDGNIYVTDFGNRRVQMYDKAGKYIRTIGRKGQGPGEYQFPSRIQFDAEGNLIVFDSRVAHKFNRDGRFKKRITLKTFTNDTVIMSTGSIFGTTQAHFEKGGPKECVAKMDADGTLVGTVAEFRGEFKESQNVIAWHQYNNRLTLSLASPSIFCYGFSSAYKIYIADAEGKSNLIITKEEKPQPITGKEKDAIKKRGPYKAIWQSGNPKPEEGMVFPDHRPFFGRLMADEKGRIYVWREKSVLDESHESVFDVFSKDGYYLYKTKLPFAPVLIKNGSVYEIRENKETGDITIVRHKIKNWDQIKREI